MLDEEAQKSTKLLFLRPVQKIACGKSFSVLTSVELRLWFTDLFHFHCNSSFESSSERNRNYACFKFVCAL